MDNVRPIRPRKPASSHRRGSRRRAIIGIVVAVVVLMLVFGGRLLGYYVDWLWFGEVGFRSVFWTRIWSQLALGLVAFAVFFIVVWANVETARRLAPSYRADEDGTLLEPRSPAVRKWVGVGGVAVCLVAALFAAVSASGGWQTFLLYFNQVPWGQKDPVLSLIHI